MKNIFIFFFNSNIFCLVNTVVVNYREMIKIRYYFPLKHYQIRDIHSNMLVYPQIVSINEKINVTTFFGYNWSGILSLHLSFKILRLVQYFSRNRIRTHVNVDGYLHDSVMISFCVTFGYLFVFSKRTLNYYLIRITRNSGDENNTGISVYGEEYARNETINVFR